MIHAGELPVSEEYVGKLVEAPPVSAIPVTYNFNTI